MSRGIDVATDDMRRHAVRVEHLSQAVVPAVQAGAEVTMHAGAYGRLCAFLGESLLPVQGAGIAAAVLALDCLAATSTTLRATAAGYDLVDGVVGEVLGALGAGLHRSDGSGQ